MRNLRGELGYSLPARRAIADVAETLPREIDWLLRPHGRVEHLALETLVARERRLIGGGQNAEARHDEFGRKSVALVRLDVPTVCLFVEMGCCNRRREDQVLAQVEAIRDMFQIGADFGLARISLGPLPFPVEFCVEAVAIDPAFGVGARAGVAVPIPSAANAAGLVDKADVQPQIVLQLVKHHQPGEAGSANQDIQLLRLFSNGLGIAHNVPPLRCARVLGPSSLEIRWERAWARLSAAPTARVGGASSGIRNCQ